jgi:DNA invertase Pin-like site-specific DNA recombinase
VSEPIGNSPVGKLLETILAGSADFDNAIRKQRCSDGMYSRIKQGIYPWKPPIGYRCKHFKKQDLKKTEPTEKLSEVLKVVVDNYGQYHECKIKVDTWVEWYKTQKDIFESVK